ncbi:hypothetical protein JCM15457_2352 [Liquorilactobacillus sucicola DSM 21376 = JCM 15457]|uniref:DUF3899 domain-containing protein n=1 Tax=Liquorilactobacillus sucicola DSM 21376 = JCM 15457 TaxID=1423806 RepID=A0A023D0R5_9LACO|nr:DUF3899 domain-containing protein [Liquorilactobacillus sucicola]KRN07232.1 hypothetical protein FD15_GL000057 [Liquorilactobacillus sucicola DSM 21376 = JCM 15457]GAJ27365.1 hypothetical protein JCM15457_2352 [Liquorilactobacillus sucicola DSM 21376 = JCM 15457]
MQRLKQKIYLKTVSVTLLLAVVFSVAAKFVLDTLLISNILFASGLLLVCVSIADLLLKAHLFAGWFQHKKKGETDEEYRENKIKVEEVGSLKNGPIRSSKFGRSCLAIGSCLILFSIWVTF